LDRLLKGGLSGDVFPPVGALIGEFAATTTDGEPMSRAQLMDVTVVAFFSPGCAPCREKLPVFVADALERGRDRERLLAVISGTGGAETSPGEATEMAHELSRVARVVLDADWAVAKAFHVNSFPGVCVVDSAGTVLASGPDLDQALTAAGLQSRVDRPAERSVSVARPS
jgi:thiol-disulfide isomerase/thioredoxin